MLFVRAPLGAGCREPSLDDSRRRLGPPGFHPHAFGFACALRLR